jgi:hypothetical protein
VPSPSSLLGTGSESPRSLWVLPCPPIEVGSGTAKWLALPWQKPGPGTTTRLHSAATCHQSIDPHLEKSVVAKAYTASQFWHRSHMWSGAGKEYLLQRSPYPCGHLHIQYDTTTLCHTEFQDTVSCQVPMCCCHYRRMVGAACNTWPLTEQRVAGHRETRRTEGDVIRTVMAMPKLSMAIMPLQSMPQATSKTSLQDMMRCSINSLHYWRLLSVTRALGI